MQRAMRDETIALKRQARVQADRRESAARRVAGGRFMRRVSAGLLAALCAALTGLTVSGRSPFRPARPLVQDAGHSIRQALLLGVLKVRTFTRMHGTPPADAAQAGLAPAASWSLRRLSPDRYTLTLKNGQALATYDSTTSVDDSFRDELRSLKGSR